MVVSTSAQVEDRRGLVALQLLEARELRVRHAAAVAEALDDPVFDGAHEREVGSDPGQVVGAGGAGEAGGALGGQAVGLGCRVVVDDAQADEAVEPFADVALVEAGGLGDLGAG